MSFTPDEVSAEAISHRPIILLGDVGVGKTSFLKHLVYVSAFDEFKNALYIYIDLGSTGALTSDLTQFVLTEIEEQLQSKYHIDVQEDTFVREVYKSEIDRFDNGIFGKQKLNNPNFYIEKLLLFLEEKTKQRDKHLKESVSHIEKVKRKQVIIVLDNADQRDYTVQQEAFIIAQNLAKEALQDLP
jgi:GTPase SAR1 family protein